MRSCFFRQLAYGKALKSPHRISRRRPFDRLRGPARLLRPPQGGSDWAVKRACALTSTYLIAAKQSEAALGKIHWPNLLRIYQKNTWRVDFVSKTDLCGSPIYSRNGFTHRCITRIIGFLFLVRMKTRGGARAEKGFTRGFFVVHVNNYSASGRDTLEGFSIGLIPE